MQADDSGLRRAYDRFYLNYIKSDTIVMMQSVLMSIYRMLAVGWHHRIVLFEWSMRRKLRLKTFVVFGNREQIS